MLEALGADIEILRRELQQFLAEALETLPGGVHKPPEQTLGFQRVLQRAAVHVQRRRSTIDGRRCWSRSSASPTPTRSTCSSSRASPGST